MRSLLTFFFIFSMNFMFGQVCIPDTTVIPTRSFIYPIPRQDTIPGSGIPNKACLNTYYEQVFHVKIPLQVEFLGFNVHVQNVKLNSITGLPAGLSYACEPTGCSMPGNTIGCMKISGVVDPSNSVKTYPITLNFTFTTVELGPLDLSFPNDAIAPGNYDIQVLPEGSSECIASASKLNIVQKAFHNISTGNLEFELESQDQINATINILNMDGRMMKSAGVKIENGKNHFYISSGQMNTGIYIYQIKSGNRIQSGKIFIY